MENCNEIFLEEIVRVELIPTASCSMPIPFNVGELTTMTGCQIGTSSMTLDVKEGTTGQIQPSPSLKTSEKPQGAGYLRQHDLQVPIQYGYNEVRAAKGTLAGVDFHVVLRTAAGNEYLLYALPNTSTISVDDQMGAESKQTVKVSLQSLSNIIKITRR